MTHAIESLPNIDSGLATELRRVGIADAETLKRTGAEAAWQRLLRAGWAGGMNGLLRLEGAIAGVRWSELPFDRRQELQVTAVAYAQGA